ncbi:hypothetical protein LTS18_001136, partial [Coniosporium uncinatum]
MLRGLHADQITEEEKHALNALSNIHLPDQCIELQAVHQTPPPSSTTIRDGLERICSQTDSRWATGKTGKAQAVETEGMQPVSVKWGLSIYRYPIGILTVHTREGSYADSR